MPILATPFQADGSLDLPGLRSITQFQLEAGVTAVAVFGMASEGFALTRPERREILNSVREVTADEIPVIAGVSGTSTATSIELALEAQDGGADALMVIPPYMVKPAAGTLPAFYAELAAAVEVPIMVQDAPNMTGVAIPPHIIAELSRIPGVESAKVEAPPTVPKIDLVLSAVTDPEFSVVGGLNSQFVLEEYARGAVGTMPACEFSDVLQPVLRDWTAGRAAEARQGFQRLLPLILFGLQPGLAWAVHKEVLVARGLIENPFVRYPASPIDDRTRASLADILADLHLPSLAKPLAVL
ncbi:dihydrodipicolinate synthase family protein [Pseudarthrobacter sp. 1C304]|uniref:dihydrodipicolinate synthase family protein n=1 Tax=Pseudarthrobacter sp. 1C304 TaxID=3457438 RepID=UPI003FD49C9C